MFEFILRNWYRLVTRFNDEEALELKNIGLWRQGVRTYDLSEYYVDSNNNLYSMNRDTWELNKKKKFDILKCSDLTTNHNDKVINTLRTTSGVKVTVVRDHLNFDQLNRTTFFIVKQTNNRKFEVLRRRYV